MPIMIQHMAIQIVFRRPNLSPTRKFTAERLVCLDVEQGRPRRTNQRSPRGILSCSMTLYSDLGVGWVIELIQPIRISKYRSKNALLIAEEHKSRQTADSNAYSKASAGLEPVLHDFSWTTMGATMKNDDFKRISLGSVSWPRYKMTSRLNYTLVHDFNRQSYSDCVPRGDPIPISSLRGRLHSPRIETRQIETS